MPTRLPKLRPDVVVNEHTTVDGVSYVVKVPATGQFYRFREVEHFICQQLDGMTSPDVIRRRVEEKYDSALDSEDLALFLKNLKTIGLLESSDLKAAAAQTRKKSWLYFRVKAFDPDQLFNKLIPYIRFMFTPAFVVTVGVCVLTALYLTISNWGGVVHDLKVLHPLQALLLAWVTILSVGMAHEFAHGLTCKYFGGEVHEVGFLFMYLHPALFCNVSDAWLFPKKSQRLWVTLAGSFFELFLWALATIGWRLTNSGTFINEVCLIVMATSGLKTIFNFNPTIRMDGYYLLADLVEVPNLRSRSFRYLREMVWKRGEKIPFEATAREKKIFLVYGLVAGILSVLFLGVIAWKLGRLFIGKYQLLGVVLFVVAFALRSRSRFRRLAPRRTEDATRPEDTRPIYRRPAWQLGTVAATLAFVFVGCADLRVTGEFGVLPLHNADVRAEVDGLVDEILVHEGDRVTSGQVIARLADRDIVSDLDKVKAELDQANAVLAMQLEGPRHEEVAAARAEASKSSELTQQAQTRFEEARRMRQEKLAKAKSDVEKSEGRLKLAENELDRSKTLLDAAVLSKKEYETVEERVMLRRDELNQARADYNMVLGDSLGDVRRQLANSERDLAQDEGRLAILNAGSRKETIEATQAEVERLTAQRNFLEGQLQRVTITSPSNGVVTTPERRLHEMRGQYVKKGDLLAEVYEMRTVTAEIAVPEREIADIQVGQRVVLKARAYPDRLFEGRVAAIATTAHHAGTDVTQAAVSPTPTSSAAREILVTTHIDNSSLLLKPDMTGKAKIECGKRRVYDLLTRRVARTVKVEFWSWW